MPITAEPEPYSSPETPMLDSLAKQSLVIGFEANTSEVRTFSRDALQRLAKELQGSGALPVTITGHTNGGKKEISYRLGLERAQTVKDLLVELGAPASLISTASRGFDERIAPETSDENRALNRRAVISLTQ